MKLAQKIISHHQTKNPYAIFPKYDYGMLQKGIYCLACGSFHIFLRNKVLVCGYCEKDEKIEHAILRNAKEFMLLFPDDYPKYLRVVQGGYK